MTVTATLWACSAPVAGSTTPKVTRSAPVKPGLGRYSSTWAGAVAVAQPGTWLVVSVPSTTTSTPPRWSPLGFTVAALPEQSGRKAA